MRCDLCSVNWKSVSTQCPCRGWGCKSCGQSNKQVSYTNELMKLWMKPDMIHSNLDFIHKAQNSRIQAFDVRDHLVNGKELSDNQKEAMEKKIPIQTPNKPKQYIGFVSQWDSPDGKHSFPSTNPRCNCIYCGWLQRYWKDKPCPTFKWEINE